MGYGQDVLKRMKLISFVVANSMGVASIDIQTLEVDRGVSWEQAMEKRSLLVGPHEGFNISVEVGFLHFLIRCFLCSSAYFSVFF